MEEIKKKIDVIIVTYNTSNTIKTLLKSIHKSVNNIFIVDNNSSNKDELILLEIEYKNLEIIFNNENLGLAKAQNIGIKKSLEKKSEFILFLDDDSRLIDNYIENMLQEYEKIPLNDTIAMLSPEIVQIVDKELKKTKIQYKKDKKIVRTFLRENETRTDVVFAISSGSMIKTEVIEKIGYFMEEYFIDEIDTEYSMRILANNLKILVTSKAKLFQKYGNKTKKNYLFIPIYITNHSAIRLYYKYRNFRYTILKYKEILPEQVYFLKKHKFLNFIRVLLFENDKALKLKYILKGLKDGKRKN
ncbi:MAG: glycosyltransferase [Cetobacterium sp.]